MLERLIYIIRKMKIYPRLLVSFIVIIITASTVILSYSSESYANKVKLSYYKNMEYTINTSATLINSILKRYEQVGKSIIEDKGLISIIGLAERKYNAIDESGYGILHDRQFKSYKKNIGQRLYNYAQEDRYIKNIVYILEEHQYGMYDINFEPQGAEIEDIEAFLQSDYYHKALEDKAAPYWGKGNENDFTYYNLEEEPHTLNLLITIDKDIFNKSLECMLVITIDMAAITDVFSSYPYEGDGDVLLVSDCGMQIPLQQSNKNQAKFSEYDYSELIRAKDNRIKVKNIQSVKSIVAYTPVPNTDMFCVNVSEYSNLLKGFEAIRNSNYLMVTVIVVLAIIVHYIITLSITIPLNKLKKTMDLIAEDNLDIRYKDDANDEITTIGVHLNNLVNRIKDLIDEVYVTQLRQKKLDFRKKNAELNALQAQINPHFIYNTLDIIRWLIIKEVGGESKASRMVLDFSTMLRIGTKKSKDIVPISEEIQHVQAYVKLINYKFNEYPISIKVDCSFDTEHYYITKLTLQPIVENCILHGFINFNTDRRIEIIGRASETTIWISVEDNGVGMNNEQLDRVQSCMLQEDEESSSIGLRNISERLKLFFGEESYLSIESTVDKGTKITVTIPYSN